MPNLILTGYPCSGKTTVAELLCERALVHPSGKIRETQIVTERSVGMSVAQSVVDTPSEQRCRSALKTAFDRSTKHTTTMNTTRNKLVVLDSTNYIKGYRYELHCLSKAAQDLHGVVWVICPPPIAKQWNRQRRRCHSNHRHNCDCKDDLSLTEETMDALIQRYEPPDERHRWDKPLYKVDFTTLASLSSSSSSVQDVMKQSVYDMHSLSTVLQPTNSLDKDCHNNSNRNNSNSNHNHPKVCIQQLIQPQPPHPKTRTEIPPLTDPEFRAQLVKRIDDILDSFLWNHKPLKEGVTTQQVTMAPSNALNQLDALTKKLVSAIVKALPTLPGGVGTLSLSLTVPPTTATAPKSYTLKLQTTVTLPQLKRYQRQYIKWVSLHPPNDTTEHGIALSFLSYLQNQTKP